MVSSVEPTLRITKAAVVAAFSELFPPDERRIVTTSDCIRTSVVSLPGRMITPGGDSGGATSALTGFQGQTEARQFDIRLSGDFDRDRPTSDNDAAAVKNVLKNAGIEAEVQPSEADFSSVSINTMSQPEAVMNALGDMVDESLEYKDELSENKK